jgi:protein-tyrosine-phosphatase
MEADMDTLIEKTVQPMLSRKKILFVSPNGACRAPLAAAMTQQRLGRQVRTGFAGFTPAAELSPAMLQAMETRGLDLAYQRPMASDLGLQGAAPDLVIVTDNATTGDPLPGVETVNWPLPLPPAGDHAAMDQLMRDVEIRIDTLVAPMD